MFLTLHEILTFSKIKEYAIIMTGNYKREVNSYINLKVYFDTILIKDYIVNGRYNDSTSVNIFVGDSLELIKLTSKLNFSDIQININDNEYCNTGIVNSIP